MVDAEKELPGLMAAFPELRGHPVEFCTVYIIGYNLSKSHPQEAKSVRMENYDRIQFHSSTSPATLLDDRYSDARGPLKAPEKRAVLKLMSEGVKWERKHPEIDIGLDPAGGFMRRMNLTYPRLRVLVGPTGIRITALNSALHLEQAPGKGTTHPKRSGRG